MTEGDWDRVMDVNLKGPFLCSQHATRQMLTQDDGHREHRGINRIGADAMASIPEDAADAVMLMLASESGSSRARN